MKKQWISPILATMILVGTGVWVGLGGSPERPAPELTEETTAVLVRTQTIALQNYIPKFDVPATVSTAAQDTLSFTGDGTLVTLNAKRGINVQEGTVLAILDSPLQEARVEEAQNSLTLAQDSLERTKKLVETGASTQTNLESAQNAVIRAETSLVDAQKDLDNRTLKAPYSGVVLDVTAQIGNRVSTGTPILTLAKINPVRIDTYLSDRELAILDQTAPGTINGKKATLEYVSPQATQSRTVLASYELADSSLRLNSAVTLSLTGAPIQASEIPLNSIIIDANGTPSVYIIENETAVLKPISILASNTSTWVTGLNEADMLVINGQNSLSNGQTVKVSP